VGRGGGGDIVGIANGRHLFTC